MNLKDYTEIRNSGMIPFEIIDDQIKEIKPFIPPLTAIKGDLVVWEGEIGCKSRHKKKYAKKTRTRKLVM